MPIKVITDLPVKICEQVKQYKVSRQLDEFRLHMLKANRKTIIATGESFNNCV